MKIKGRGSVIPLEDKPNNKCRHWKLQVSLGRHPSKPNFYPKKTRNFVGTITEARSELEKFKKELEGLPDITTTLDNPTVSELCEVWKQKRADSGKFAKRTLQGDEYRLRQYVHHIGNLYVHDLTPDVVDEVHSKMLQGDTLSGRPSTRTTIMSGYKTFKQVLKFAYKKGLLSRDITGDVTPYGSDTEEKKALTIDQMVAFLNSLDATNPLDLALIVLLLCGLRRSEVLAIKWCDYRGDCFAICRALEEDGTYKETKNEASADIIPVISTLATLLDTWKELHQQNLDNAGVDVDINDLPIFHNGLASTFKPRNLTSYWDKLRKELNLESWTLHELRHTFSTALFNEDIHPKLAQSLLRHASITTTMDTYTHVSLNKKKEAVGFLEARFAPYLLLKEQNLNKNAS